MHDFLLLLVAEVMLSRLEQAFIFRFIWKHFLAICDTWPYILFYVLFIYAEHCWVSRCQESVR